MIYLDLPSDYVPGMCSISRDTNQIILDTVNPSVSVTDAGETIESLGSNQCGARVHNFTSISTVVWALETWQPGGLSDYWRSLRVEVITSIPETEVSSFSGVEGDFGTISCPGDYNHQRHCEIIDPQGLVHEGCELRVKYPAVSSGPQVFHCHVYYWGRMDSFAAELHVESMESPAKVLALTEEDATHVVFSCSVKEEALSVCRAESLSSGIQFLIMDGFQSQRYSAWKTHLQNGICQLEIPKPYAANEVGIWRIHAKLPSSGNEWTGCVFRLDVDFNSEYESFRNRLLEGTPVQVTTTSEQIEFRCANAPYPLEYCYLVTPSKEVIQPSLRQMALFKTYGRCTFSSVPAETGRYSCGFNSPDHSEDLFQHFDVHYSDPGVFVAAERETVSMADQSGRLSLMCFALQDYAISSCSFVAPSGELYHLPSSSFSNSQYAYVGGGFVAGHCGLELFRVDDGHLGNWTCSVELVGRTGRFNAHLVVVAVEEQDAEPSLSECPRVKGDQRE